MCSVLFGASLASALKAKKTKKRNGKERHEKRIEKVKTAKKKSGSSRHRQQEKNYRKLGERYAMSLGELSTKAKDLFGNDVRNVTRDELKEYAYALTEWRKLWSQVCRLNNLKNLEAAAVQAAPLFDGLKKFGERIKAKANVTTLLQTACDEFKRASEPKKLQWLRTAARVVMPRVEVLQIDALMAPRSGGFEKKPQTDAAQSEEEKVRKSIEMFNERLFGISLQLCMLILIQAKARSIVCVGGPTTESGWRHTSAFRRDERRGCATFNRTSILAKSTCL